MPLEKQIGDAATALSQNQYVDALDGTYWVSGWDATLGTGDLEVDIAPGEGAINTGSVETTETQTVDFAGDPDADNPRKAVISVDDTGTVQKTLGDPTPADPEGEARERTFDPSPPTNAPGVVVAEVWLAAGASELVSEDVRDRRVSNNAVSAAGDALGFEEDPNSPHQISDADGEITIANEYDIVKLSLSFNNESTSSSTIRMTVNGDSGDNYTVAAVDGSISDRSEAQIASITGGQVVSMDVNMTGSWDSDGGWSLWGGPGPCMDSGDSNVVAQSVGNTNVTSPLDTINIFAPFFDNWSATVQIFGRDIE